jgi:hypothetical protein
MANPSSSAEDEAINAFNQLKRKVVLSRSTFSQVHVPRRCLNNVHARTVCATAHDGIPLVRILIRAYVRTQSMPRVTMGYIIEYM